MKDREEVDELDVDEALIEEYIVEPSSEMTTAEPPLCAICEMVMIQLENELKDKDTQAEIENAVRGICSKMPNKIAKPCNKMIDEYGTAIITFLDTMPPKKICAQIQLCLSKVRDNDKDIIECAVCQGAVYTLDHVLNNEQIDEDIETLVEKICTSFPSKFVKKVIL
jgi:saposin